MRIRALFAAVALLAPSLAPAFEIKPSARLSLAGSYSSIPPKSSWGANGNLFLLPALQQGDWSFLPLLAAFSKTSEQAIAEDTFFVESYNFLAKPQIRYTRGDLTYKLFGGAKRSINKETSAEVWSTGRYDTEEYGVGLGVSWKAPLSWLGQAGLSLEDLHRTYMNFHEQGTQVVNNKNYYSKDYDGWKLSLDAEAAKDTRWPWSFGYTLLLKNYTDSYVVKKDGVLNLGLLRADQLHRFDGTLLGAFGEKAAWNVSAGLDLNVSNQGYFDPAVLLFNEDFYGYVAESLGLGLTWMPKGQEGPTLTPSYSITNRTYTGRLVRWPNGDFTQSKQADLEHRLGLDSRWPLRKWVAATAGVDYLSVLSNQSFTTRIKPTYDVFRANLGFDLSY